MRTIAVLALALWVSVPWTAKAQQPAKAARVGVLTAAPREAHRGVATLVAQLREMGYVEGQNLVIEYRHSAGKAERYAGLAAELVALKVDVIFATEPYALRASRQAAAAIPIVGHDLESDPVASGFAASFARPAGNVTGVFLDQPELSAKQLQLLKDAVPRLTRVAVLWDSPLAEFQFKTVEGAALKLGVTVHSIVWHGPGELPDALRGATRDGGRGLIVLSSPLISLYRRAIVEATLRSRLPSITLFPEFAEEGVLMAYGPDRAALYRMAAKLVGKILGGAWPGDLPIERPARFEFVINAKTAKALGLTLPPSLIQRADRIIE